MDQAIWSSSMESVTNGCYCRAGIWVGAASGMTGQIVAVDGGKFSD